MTTNLQNRRYIAAKILNEIGDEGYSNRVLDSALANCKLDSQAKGFVTRMVYGTVSKRLFLDYLIELYCANKKLTLPIRNVLRLGLYQLKFMDKLPDNAVVNETVKLAADFGQKSATAMCNAVLRQYIRQGKPSPPKENLSAYFSVAPLVIKLWTKKYGQDTCLALLHAFEADFTPFVRVNTLKTTQTQLIKQLESEGVQASETGLQNCLHLDLTGQITALQSFQDGLFHVQDLSSQICCAALGAKAGDDVIDFCAAPGGKSFTVAQAMQNQGDVLSLDLYEEKIKAVKAGAKRLGIANLTAATHDATKSIDKKADKILCDVPCSGLGIMGKKPDLRYKSWDEVKNLPDTQLQILCNAAAHLKVGGVLVYSTCTLNPTENDGVVQKFLRENTDFVAENIGISCAKFDIIGESVTLFPHIHGCDGFFLAKLKRVR